MRHMPNRMQVSRYMAYQMRFIEDAGQFEKSDRFGMMFGSANLPTIGQSKDATIAFGWLTRLFGFIRQSPGIRSMWGCVPSPIARNHYGTYQIWGD